MKTVVLSVGGSIIIPKTGFDFKFLRAFRNLILAEARRGVRFILVVGGGTTARAYQDAGRQIGGVMDRDLHWVGILATQLNAELVRAIFGSHAYSRVIDETQKPKTAKKIIVAGGRAPGASTDMGAVLLAKLYGSHEVINLSNIPYLYDSDPRMSAQAKKIEHITWRKYRQMFGRVHTPGMNVPFDPVASRLAAAAGMTVRMVQGTDLPAVRVAIQGERFRGTIISEREPLNF